MTVLDLGNNVAVNSQIAVSIISASAADATAVDMSGVTWAIAVINAGAKAGSSSIYTFKIEEASDNATFTTAKKWEDGEVSADDAEIVIAADGTGQSQFYLVDLDTRHLKRYVRLACDLSGGGSDNFYVGASIITMPDFTGDADTPDMSA